MVATVRCEEPDDRAEMILHWRDEHGALIAENSEQVIPGAKPNDQFVWNRAPERATTVAVGISTAAGDTCEFNRVSLFPSIAGASE
jgi:hypothetical protein